MEKKIFIILLAVVGFFLTSSSAIAQESQVSTGVNPGNNDKEGRVIVLATISIYNSKIVSQDGNNLKLSFDINNQTGVQPGVKYSVQLTDKKNNQIVDSRIFDETLTVKEKETVHKEVDYIAPDYLNGEFTVWIVSQHESGMSLGRGIAGDIALTGNNEFIFIDEKSCQLSVEGEIDKTYMLKQGVDISDKENLLLSCDISNLFSSNIIATPQFNMYYRTVWGKLLGQEKQNPISFSPGELKKIQLNIPKNKESQAYDVELVLQDKSGKNISNKIIAHYVLRGLSATIQNLRLDKDIYKKGDVAKISFFWTGSADNFPDSRGKSSDLENASLFFSITDSMGKECADLLVKPVKDLARGGIVDFDLPITRDCLNPVIASAVKSNDLVLAKDEIELISEDNENSKPIEKKSNSAFIILGSIFVIIIITVLILIAVIRKRKKNNFIEMVVFFLSISISFLILIDSAEAVTFTVQSDGDGDYFTDAIYDVGLNKPTYYSGETITATGAVSQLATCANGVEYAGLDVSIGGNAWTNLVNVDNQNGFNKTSGTATAIAGGVGNGWSADFYGQGYYSNGAHKLLYYDIIAPSYSCTGTGPDLINTFACSGDAAYLTSTLDWSHVGISSSSCTSTRKCEYYTSATPYSCTGTAPNGSSTIMCTGDNTSLTSTLAWTNVGTSSSSCTSTRKCEYYTPATTYSCSGDIPNGSYSCPDDHAGLTSSGSWHEVGTSSSSCTDATKCEYYTPPPTYDCINMPTGGVAWDSEEDDDLSADKDWVYATADTSVKCQYKCRDGYVRIGSVCVAGPNLTFYISNPMDPRNDRNPEKNTNVDLVLGSIAQFAYKASGTTTYPVSYCEASTSPVTGGGSWSGSQAFVDGTLVYSGDIQPSVAAYYYMYRLTCYNSAGAYTSRTVSIRVNEPPALNRPPTAEITKPTIAETYNYPGPTLQRFEGRGTDTLDDPAGTITAYRWFISNSDTYSEGCTALNPMLFTASYTTRTTTNFSLLDDTIYSVCLRVQDDDGAWSAPDYLKITVGTPPLTCSETAPDGITQIMCSNDDTGLTVATAWANVGTTLSSCTDTRKCEYYTPSPISYSCFPNSKEIACDGRCGGEPVESYCYGTDMIEYDDETLCAPAGCPSFDCDPCSTNSPSPSNWTEVNP